MRDVRFSAGQLQVNQLSARFYKLSHLRKLRGSEQVAAVCYRVSANGIEFLLVQTRSGRWTFPKGGVEPGLTHAQAAALEAFEEAGVHGRMEESSFARYLCGRGKANSKNKEDRGARHSTRSAAMSAGKELVIHAHLCEVLRLTPPQESGRNPAWFSAKKAKRRLRENRAQNHAVELARVIDRAVSRIQRLSGGTDHAAEGRLLAGSQALPSARDPLNRVQFEAVQLVDLRDGIQEVSQALFTRYIRRQRDGVRQSAAIELAVNAYLSKVLRLSPAEVSSEGGMSSAGKARRRLREAPNYDARIPPVIAQAITRVPQLPSGNPADMQNKVTQIDNGRRLTGKTKAARNRQENR